MLKIWATEKEYKQNSLVTNEKYLMTGIQVNTCCIPNEETQNSNAHFSTVAY